MISVSIVLFLLRPTGESSLEESVWVLLVVRPYLNEALSVLGTTLQRQPSQSKDDTKCCLSQSGSGSSNQVPYCEQSDLAVLNCREKTSSLGMSYLTTFSPVESPTLNLSLSSH